MNGFMISVNEALETVDKRHKTAAKALNELQAILQGNEKSLLKIKAYSNELKQIGANL
jgi:prefoldin subunit 5